MIGTRLERYDILEEVGQGGMSVVYAGRDTVLNRRVAVKVLHDHLSGDPENRERFRREAEAIARLDQPHVLDVYDYSDEDDDHAYIVMEYVEGQTLREFLRVHPEPPPETAALIGAQIADALAHAHTHGVIHRDLKPENVMVTDGGSIKLMDFGIAHVADAESVTQTGSLLGSPAHMAPEIIDGQSVNVRSDIFSLGTVLYWLCTGSFPFEGENAPHVLQQVLECDYDPPQHVEPRVPAEISEIICRCMSRNPRARFTDVEHLRSALLEAVDTLGAVDPILEIESYFADPEGYVESFEESIVETLTERGDRAMDDGDVPRAMRHYSRALEYDPENAHVTRALEDLDRTERNRRRMGWLAGGLAAAILAALAILAYTGASGASEADIDRAVAQISHGVSAARSGATRAATVRQASRRIATSSRRALRGATRRAASRAGVATIAEGRSTCRALSRRLVRRTESRPPDETSSESGAPAGPEGGRPAEDDQTWRYRIRVVPLAASVTIDGERMSATRALRGVELGRGVHRIEANSRGCDPLRETLRVDGPAREMVEFRLDWRDAAIDVFTDRPAVVYVNGDTSEPYEIGADGTSNRIPIPFGKATSSGNRSRRRVQLEIRPRDNLQSVHRQTVTLRPGETASVSVDFSPEE